MLRHLFNAQEQHQSTSSPVVSAHMIANMVKNVIVVGGSYVGRATAQELAKVVPSSHRVLLIEPHSHFHHLFVFPRFAIVPSHEHKAFVPYTNLFSSVPNSASHAVVHARVVSVQPRHVNLDREWEGSRQIPFDYLTVATGTLLSQPAAMRKDDKQSSVEYLKQHQEAIKQAKSILLVGGGAVGVQMATDLKEYYPAKDVTLVHSRVHLMPQYHHKFHDLVKKRFDELHVNLITGARVRIPPQGFPTNGSPFEVQLTNGQKVTTEFVILATGQSPNNSLVRDLEPENPNAVINPENGYIRVRSTLQFLDDKYPNLFAVGDIADSGAHKAARPGVAQAAVVAKNVQSLIEGRQAEEKYVPGPAGIHLSLGMKENVIFRNPNKAEGETEPTIMPKSE
ncbi:hypothetical protein, variant [Exophiala oligosperma]|uniref:FAD/NAD(P)-binding domain-containing protein n=1 Tax=Exophiala oligosperma TaxID=215243 RepID=A0A0D2DH64_9EURO|nr:hypothetical protein, variant [Exophiala oligosperma]KIW42353.1 hypothetical protein, variant [Exophiala oligosperma]